MGKNIDDCLLGVKNKQQLDDLEKRLDSVEKRIFGNEKRLGGNRDSTLKTAGIIVCIIISGLGAIEWVGRDVEVQRATHIADYERLAKTIEYKDISTKEIFEAENSRTLSRLVKLEEWQRWWYRTMSYVDSSQDVALLRWKEQHTEKKKNVIEV